MRPSFAERYPSIEVCERDLCPMCADRARGFDTYAKQARQYEQEEMFREGRAPMPDRIKVAWEAYGKGRSWEGDYIRLNYQPRMRVADYKATSATEMTALKYETFEFERTVTRRQDFTVTRVSCQGVTVEETYS